MEQNIFIVSIVLIYTSYQNQKSERTGKLIGDLAHERTTPK